MYKWISVFVCVKLASVQFSHSVVSDSLRPHESQHTRPPCPSPTPGVHSDTSIESVMPSSHLILWRPLLLLPPIPPSIRVFSNESALRMRWPKYWSFSFSIIPSKEIPGLISIRMDWLNLLAVQGTLKSSPTPQFKSINSSVLSYSRGQTPFRTPYWGWTPSTSGMNMLMLWWYNCLHLCQCWCVITISPFLGIHLCTWYHTWVLLLLSCLGIQSGSETFWKSQVWTSFPRGTC